MWKSWRKEIGGPRLGNGRRNCRRRRGEEGEGVLQKHLMKGNVG